MGPMVNLRTPHQLFLDLSRIQIQTETHLLPLLGPTILCLLPCFLSLSLSLLLSAITEEGSTLSKQKIPIARTYSIHSSSKKTSSQTHSKKIPNQNLSSSTNKNTTRQKKKKKKRDPLKKKLKPTSL